MANFFFFLLTIEHFTGKYCKIQSHQKTKQKQQTKNHKNEKCPESIQTRGSRITEAPGGRSESEARGGMQDVNIETCILYKTAV